MPGYLANQSALAYPRLTRDQEEPADPRPGVVEAGK
jgi:hypothetical protein